MDRQTGKWPLALLGAALALAMALAGCGGTGGRNTAGNSVEADGALGSYAAEAPADKSAAAAVGGTDSGSALDPAALDSTAESSRKIVYTANLTLESKEYDSAAQALTDAVAAAGGYLESSDLGGSAESGSRWCSYTARIPVDAYRSFLAAAGKAGSVTQQNESAQDITSNYIDVQARLTALNDQRYRLNALAVKAETTADLLEIEKQLSDVQYQIESYTQQLRAMDGQIQYCTVNITLNEVAALTPTGTSFGTRLANAFSGGWRGFGHAMQNLAVALVYLMPLLLLAAIGTAIGFAVHRQRARHPKPPKARRPGAPGAPAAYTAQAPSAAPPLAGGAGQPAAPRYAPQPPQAAEPQPPKDPNAR